MAVPLTLCLATLKKVTQLMSIYSNFVTEDKLISPVNGHTCRRITKQNIKRFGFDTVEDLHEQYPDFPLMCAEYHNHIILALHKGSIKSHQIKKKNSELNKISQQQNYLSKPEICPKCKNMIPFELKKKINFVVENVQIVEFKQKKSTAKDQQR